MEPVFYDGTGLRNRWTLRLFFAGLVLLVVAIGLFATTVVEVPVPRPLALAMEHPLPRPLAQQVGHMRRQARRGLTAISNNLPSWLPGLAVTAPVSQHRDQVSVGFYVPWDDASRSSLIAHIRQLDWVVPAMLSVTGPRHDLSVADDPRFDALLAGAAARPKLLPMIQNSSNDNWDSRGLAALLRDAKARAALLGRLERYITAKKADGIVFDFEEVPAAAQPAYLSFLREARARFAPRGWLVTVAVPVEDRDWNLADYATVADRLFLMVYDEHSPDGAAGPIASQGWFARTIERTLAKVPPGKAIVAIGNYAYDWTRPGAANDLSVEEAWLIAHDSEAPVTFDAVSGNTTFDYEEGGQPHSVWILDAASAWNQLRTAHMTGAAGVALWRLGSEDSGYWKALASYRIGKVPDLSRAESVGNVDVEGSGEILRIDDVQTVGARSVVADPNGLIVNEVFSRLPTPYVVRRTGYKPGLVALTFDDGPDPQWTPQVLHILKAKNVPGTFFVIGESAVEHPLLINRIIDQGSEIGSHTFTHPNLAQVSARGTLLELNATQRLIEAYSGRSVRLFRAPYFGDAEPTTLNELTPALTAQRAGYTNVGLHVDPNDWQRPGAPTIVSQALAQVQAGTAEQSAQIILLHDGGGDRSQTVAALPRIIDGLRAKGYTFVPVSQLAGLTPDQVMPRVTGPDLIAVRADVGLFLIVAGLMYLIRWMFFAAIGLGIARALALTALAVVSDRPSNRPGRPPTMGSQFVSVLIPAFNEEAVIIASIHRVLASIDVDVEVIVIDDGSTDRTSPIVAEVFGQESRVKLLTSENGGKAHALNKGLTLARGAIVIALDADTQFEPATIAKLARWFVNPKLGAVAGNAKVGNRVNLVTRWQAIEYVTAQNLERRALARFNAIMVVPGAVGAWRRAALDDVGGYPTDTLAEDQDLTIAIQRRGWAVTYDADAVAWTEAPESFRTLAKQRFRWAYGTLQCLWKHRRVLRQRNPAGLALVGIPQAWVFQIGFALVSPLIDLALLASIAATVLRVCQHGWAQTQSDVLRMSLYWLAFTTVDVLCGWIAYRLERREKHYPAVLLVMQRFVYRQLMYGVVIRAVSNAIRGPWVGWGKLERSGRVRAET